MTTITSETSGHFRDFTFCVCNDTEAEEYMAWEVEVRLGEIIFCYSRLVKHLTI